MLIRKVWRSKWGKQMLFSVTECLCHKWPRICSVCRNHNPVLSSYMTYHQGSNKSNMIGVDIHWLVRYVMVTDHLVPFLWKIHVSMIKENMTFCVVVFCRWLFECKYGSCGSIVSFLRIVLLIIGCPFVVFLSGPLYCLPSFDSRHLFTSFASSNFSY
jgi:hypothetical protein